MDKINNLDETKLKKNSKSSLKNDLKNSVKIEKLNNRDSASPNKMRKSQNSSQPKGSNNKNKEKTNLVKGKNKLNNQNPIPTNLKERINYIKNLLKKSELIKYLNGGPPKNSSSLEEISKYLNNYSKNEVEVLALIFLWVCNCISYDATSFFSRASPDSSAQNVFKTGLALSEGYANLFSAMCNSIDLKCEIIQGFAKGPYYKYGENCAQNNHQWNAVNIYGNQYLVDTMYGSGSLNVIDKKFDKKLNMIYFLTFPEVLILSHRPEQNKFQLTQKNISLRQFEGKKKIISSEFYYSVLEKNIELITHPIAEINHIEKEIKIKLGCKGLILTGQFLKNGDEIPSLMKIDSDPVSGLHKFHLTFETNAIYELNISSKNTGESDKNQNFTQLLTYVINVNIIETKKSKSKIPIDTMATIKKSSSLGQIKPNKKTIESSLLNNQPSSEILFSTKNDTLISANKPKCFDNSNAFIFEPKNNNIKIGVAIKFKIKVKGAINVAVLDYKQFHFLKKKGEDLWEGTITLKTGFVSILSQKSSSLFTEVYEFTNFK